MATQTQSYGLTTESASLNDIVAGDFPIVTAPILLAAGSGTLTRGTVLGRKKGSATIAAAPGNTGDASLAAVSVTTGANAEPGTYVLTCTAESSNGGTFSVVSPSGIPLANLTVASAYATSHIALTLPDGAEDWATGDVVLVTVVDDGEWVAYDADGTHDGRRVARAILATDSVTLDDTDSTAATAFVTGMFRGAALTGADSAGRAQLAARAIFVRD